MVTVGVSGMGYGLVLGISCLYSFDRFCVDLELFLVVGVALVMYVLYVPKI
jgi:hypothetical protein